MQDYFGIILLPQGSNVRAGLCEGRIVRIVVVVVDAPDLPTILQGSMLILANAIVTALASELGIDPALNPFSNLLGFLKGVIVSPAPITPALKGDGLVRAGSGLF
jgi:hypothetical protein